MYTVHLGLTVGSWRQLGTCVGKCVASIQPKFCHKMWSQWRV